MLNQSGLVRIFEPHMTCVRWVSLGLLLTGCVTSTRDRMVRTQIITFPDGHDRVEVNGMYLGTTPFVLTLPQDEKGNVAGRTEIKIVPVVPGRYAQARIFDGASRLDP